MNKKAEKLRVYLAENKFSARVTELADQLNTMYITITANEGRKYVLQLDDTDFVCCLCVLAQNIDVQNEKNMPIYRLCNELSEERRVFHYMVNPSGMLEVLFSDYVTDAEFDPAVLINYCCMVDEAVEEDLPKFVSLLEQAVLKETPNA